MIKVQDICDGKYDQDKIIEKQSNSVCELIDKYGGLNLEGNAQEQIRKGKDFICDLNKILQV